MKKNREFAKILRKLRTSKGISQEKLSLEANLARTYISLLERELRSPSLKTINKICEVLEILPSNFLELVEQEKIKTQTEELQKRDDCLKPEVLYSHSIDIIGNTLNILVVDAELNITFSNKNLCKLLEYKKDDLTGLNLASISNTDSTKKVHKSIKDVSNGKNPYKHIDIVCKTKSGTTIHFTTAVMQYAKLPNGATMLVLIDFTKYKRALQLNETRLESLLKFNKMIDAPLREITDYAVNEIAALTQSEYGLIFLINEENNLSLYSTTKNVIDGCRIKNHEEILKNFKTYGIMHSAVKTQKPVTVNNSTEHKFQYPEGHVDISNFTCVPVAENGEVVMLGAVANKLEDYDTSDIKQLSLLLHGLWRIIQYKGALNEISKREKKLAVSSRFASMNVLCRCISDEINDPMAMINNFNKKLGKITNISENNDLTYIKDTVDNIDIMINKVSSVVKNMQSLVQNSTMGRINNINITDLLDNGMNFVKEKLQRENINLIIENKLLTDLTIDCHTSLVTEALLNLLYNSIDALTINKHDEKWIKIEIVELDENIRISVIDCGNGIHADIVDRIFDPYFSTKENYGGHGLGLTVSRSFIEDHNGTLEFDKSQKHTCFNITLPKKQTYSNLPHTDTSLNIYN